MSSFLKSLGALELDNYHSNTFVPSVEGQNS